MWIRHKRSGVQQPKATGHQLSIAGESPTTTKFPNAHLNVVAHTDSRTLCGANIGEHAFI